MIIERLPEPIDALVIKDTFPEGELSNIKNEVKSFASKFNSGETVWLAEVYKDLDMSAIHRNSMETLFNAGIVDSLTHINSLYGIYGLVNNHSTQVKYFGQSQSYPLHYDAAAFTVTTFIFDEPKNFEGVTFTVQVGGEIAYEQEVENNMTVIIPSCYYFALSEVNLNNKDIEGSGLHAITSYLFVESR